MKKLLSLVLCLTLSLSVLVGCADNSVKEPQNDTIVSQDSLVTAVPETDNEITSADTATEEVTTSKEVTTAEETTTAEQTTAVTTTTEETTTEATTTLWYEVTPASEKLYATADLTVRAEPDKSSKRISHVDKGDLIEVTGYTNNGWARIKFRDGEYFVNASYLSQEKPLEEVTTAATTIATTAKTESAKEYYYDYTKSKYDLTAAIETDSLKELCKNYFKLGVGLTGNARSNGAVNSEEYMAIVYKHFNSVTLTNLMKPSYLLSQSGCKANANKGDKTTVAVNFSSVDPTLKWCYENGIQMRGHTLVWHTQTPDWFFREGYNETGDYVDYETMAARLDSYIKQVVTYCQETYPGVIYCWDVVNEAVDTGSKASGSYFACRTKCDGKDNPWYKTLGEDYVELAFKSARKYADKDVKLFYNDYNVCATDKLGYVYALCKNLHDKSLLDGVGLQDCWSVAWPDISKIESGIKKFDSLGIEIHISEMSLTMESVSDYNLQQQAKRYEDIFKLLLKLDTDGGGKSNITSVTIFSLMDGYVFYDNDKTNYTMFDTNFRPKPCFYSVQKVLSTCK